MSTAVKQSPIALRDVLYEFAIAKATPDPELLDEFARRYPQYASEITDFAIEVLCESLDDDEDVCPITVATVSPAVSRAMSKYQSALYAVEAKTKKHDATEVVKDAIVESPFAALEQKSFRALAKALNINSVFLCKIRDRQIIPETIRIGFLRLLCEQLKESLENITSFVNAKPLSLGVQYYKADEKPVVGAQQSFEEAVRSSGLTAEQEAFLLSL